MFITAIGNEYNSHDHFTSVNVNSATLLVSCTTTIRHQKQLSRVEMHEPINI